MENFLLTGKSQKCSRFFNSKKTKEKKRKSVRISFGKDSQANHGHVFNVALYVKC